MDEEMVHSLVDSTSQMYILLMRSDPRSEYKDLVECATIGCSLLRDERYIRALVADARRFQEMAAVDRTDVDEAMANRRSQAIEAIQAGGITVS